MSTKKQLKQKYIKDVQASIYPADHAKSYNKYLADLHKLDDTNDIFQYLQVEPFQNLVEGFFAFLLEEISYPELYDWMYESSIELYSNNLLEVELIEEAKKPEKLSDLCEEVIFEFMKGADTLDKITERYYYGDDLTIEQKLILRAQDRVIHIGWFNLLEKLHKHFKLPKVKKFSSCFIPLSMTRIAFQILIGDDFSEFWLESGDLETYRQLCLLS